MNIMNFIQATCLLFFLTIVEQMLGDMALYAQRGAWINHDPVIPVNGSWYSDAGNTCVGAVPANSQYIYFFDSMSSQWTEIDLGSSQSFQALEAEGETIIAFSGMACVAR